MQNDNRGPIREFQKHWKRFFQKYCLINLACNYELSIENYTKALEFNGGSAKSAIYLSNRASAHIKMENYGLAIEDANAAIKLDPSYAKSYYRKADSYIALA